MADYCCEYTLNGSPIINNDGASANTLIIGDDGDIIGLDGAPIRKQIDNSGQTNGGIVHPGFFAPRIITFQGEVLIQSVAFEDTAAYLTAVNSLEASTVSTLEGFLNSEVSLAWTPTGGSGKSISVTYGTPGGEIQFSGAMRPGDRKFTFTLVADNPTIS